MEAGSSEDQQDRREGRSSRLVLWIAGVLAAVLIAVVLFIVLSSRDLRSYRNQSGAMLPTLRVGQSLDVDESTRSPQRGEIVAFHPPAAFTAATPRCPVAGQGLGTSHPCGGADSADVASQTLVKRVVGLPGDRIALVGGRVIRDGAKLSESYAQPCSDYNLCTFPRSIVVPAGQYFVLGDNRGSSDDSRFWGPIRGSWIVGTLVHCHFFGSFCSTVH